ncbi:hypothetical protein [Bradyrhizobium sp.]|jgi:hypothetical protein|uniref:hypothetical protein n=1 Tax=Bradyrhizobium sp. TaxID=376 RepID=UPI003C1E6C1F
MISKNQFAAFEFMCRERAALARKDMEYWLAEAQEWKELSNSTASLLDANSAPATGFTESPYQY